MDKQDRQPWENEDSWIRVVIMIVVGIAYWLSQFVVGSVALVQLGFVLITGHRNQQLTRFGAHMALYIGEIVNFLTFNSDHRPFPFSEFPCADDNINSDASDTTEPPATAKTAEDSHETPPVALKKKKTAKKKARKRGKTSVKKAVAETSEGQPTGDDST